MNTMLLGHESFKHKTVAVTSLIPVTKLRDIGGFRQIMSEYRSRMENVN